MKTLLKDHGVDASYLEAWGGVEVTGPMTMEEYFRTPENTYPTSLVYGYLVRDNQPAPLRHQGPLILLSRRLMDHVHGGGLGVVLPSCDVILDEEHDLVLAPDLMVILTERLEIIGDRRIESAPDLAIELLSPSTSRRDRTVKLECYRENGVQEYWIVDVAKRRIQVVDFSVDRIGGPDAGRAFTGSDTLESRVLPDFRPQLDQLFDELTYVTYAKLRATGGIRRTSDASS